MARLGDLFDAIEERLRDNLADRGLPIPTFGRSLAESAKFKSKPSIMLVPTEAKRTTSRGTGGDPSALCTRHLQIAARIYADDIDPCNELAERLIEAIADEYEGHYEYEGEQWDTAGTHSGGMVLVVFFRFAVRWERLPLKIVEPTEMVLTPAIVTELSS